MSFLGHCNEAGGFRKHWHSLRVEAQVEKVLENFIKLTGTGLQHTRADAVQQLFSA